VDGRDYATSLQLAKLLDAFQHFLIEDPPIRYRAFYPDTWISIDLIEGKSPVRKMTAAVGQSYAAIGAMGPWRKIIHLKDSVGEFRKMDEESVTISRAHRFSQNE